MYRDAITPTRVAELLILQAKMPRSLIACVAAVVENLREVRNDVSGDTERQAQKLHAMLQSVDIDEILERGLHEFLTSYLASIADIGQGISRDFLMPPASIEEESAPSQSQTQSQTQTQTR